ncbi:MAG: hypothetical protein KBE67_02345, partial [Vitreoscilla sp.]|nr:hypothetical protein [Vitreoscilla sp.]
NLLMRLALDSGRLLDGMSDHVARGMTVQRQNPAYRHTVMHPPSFSQTHGVAMFSFIFKNASQTMFMHGYGSVNHISL